MFSGDRASQCMPITSCSTVRDFSFRSSDMVKGSFPSASGVVSRITKVRFIREERAGPPSPPCGTSGRASDHAMRKTAAPNLSVTPPIPRPRGEDTNRIVVVARSEPPFGMPHRQDGRKGSLCRRWIDVRTTPARQQRDQCNHDRRQRRADLGAAVHAC